MSIVKSKVVGILFLMTTGILLNTLPLGKQKAKAATNANKLTMTARSRIETSEGSRKFKVANSQQEWKSSETAIIICDMWNQHWCKGATRRVRELAERMNQVVRNARDKGVLIVHSPSGTISHYKDHPSRKRAQNAPEAANVPKGISKWCTLKGELEKKFEYPIDQSDGGCDCDPQCKQGSLWRKQIDTIKIFDEDAISDSGVEIWNLLEQRGINNVILMGVHTNMCVLGRPFGLRNMARYGKNVVLMRDQTDTMYNSRMRPFVNHFTGTDLIVEHIEKFVCPTITSTALTGGPGFIFRNDKRLRVVFISAESEYGAAESLPGFAHELETKYGLYCEVLQGSTEKSGPERHEIVGMEALEKADLVVVFARRRAFPQEQMKYLHLYLGMGKPLIGLRTASHAFDARGKGPKDHAEWPMFDSKVLGGNYHGHYGRGPTTTVTPADGAERHTILAGVRTPFTSISSLYEASPLMKSTKTLLIGTIPDKEPEPIAWTNRYRKSRIFYTSLGHVDDFKNPQFRQLLINAVFWAMEKPVPKIKAGSKR
ncbi:MAG: ThuA domain-containing protein [Planctomycetota bacterium]|jgi:type 1 glutamine amidotransferase/nicotinamidase-related amidase